MPSSLSHGVTYKVRSEHAIIIESGFQMRDLLCNLGLMHAIIIESGFQMRDLRCNRGLMPAILIESGMLNGTAASLWTWRMRMIQLVSKK